MQLWETFIFSCFSDWWKAVQALGILSMLFAVATIGLLVYSLVGDGKGDRARLLPLFSSATALIAGKSWVVFIFCQKLEK